MSPLTLVALFSLAQPSQPEPTQEPELLPEAGIAVEVPAEPAPEEPVAPVVDENTWAGELKRVHFGVGAKLHGGAMLSEGSPYVIYQSEVFGTVSIRVRQHDELRIQIGLAVGFPDVFGGETNVSFRRHLTPRWSIGLGAFVYLGMPSMRGGLEIPFAVRLGATRRHEISLALRAHAGVFNDTSYIWWEFPKQRFGFGADLALGYTFIF